MIRALHIFSGFGGGISSLILNLAQNKADDICFDTMAFTYKNGEHFVNAITSGGGRCFTMPRPRKKGVIAFQRFVEQVIRQGQYDVVHCHLSGWMIIPFAKVAKRQGVKKLIIHAHTSHDENWISRIPVVHRLGQKLNYKWADVYMTCSDLAASYVFGDFYLGKKGVTLIPNGMNKENFSVVVSQQDKEELRRALNIPDHARLVGHVGRFNTPKNHDKILEIAQATVRKDPNIRFLLIGVGERMDEIRKKAAKKDLKDVVYFLGRRTDISKLMQLFDVMILPSFFEGLPTVAIECQASGTPMLISDFVTRQCDMGLGLTQFLPIADAELWAQTILETMDQSVNPEYCLEMIDKNGFTAKTAGTLYSSCVRE